MIPRRVFLGAAALLPLAADNAFAQAPTVTPVHVQDLPDVRLDEWTAPVVAGQALADTEWSTPDGS